MTIPIFDHAGVMMRLENDEELFRELLDVFRDEHPGILNEIERCASQMDGAGLTLSAHSLKGALGNVGAERAAAIARALETAGKANDFKNATAQVAQLRIEVAAYCKELKIGPAK